MSTTVPLKFMMARTTNLRSFLQTCALASGTALFVVFVPVFVGLGGPWPGSGEALAATASLLPEPDLQVSEEPQAEDLTPRMRAALDYVAHRYRVSADALGPIFQAAQVAGRDLRLDPLLIVAVIGIESGFNPFSQSVMGAQGLMQVIPRFHRDKLPEGAGPTQLLDPVTNIQVGAQALEEAIRRQGGLMSGLQRFAGAANDEGQGYATRVLAEKQRLEQAAARVSQG